MKSSAKRLSLVSMLVLGLLLGGLAQIAVAQDEPPPEPEPPAPAVRVNSAEITVAQVEEALPKDFTGPALKQLIDRELVRQEAARLNVAVTEEQIAAYIAAAETQMPALRRAGREGLSTEALKTQMRYQALLHTLISQFRARLIEREAKAYYEANKSKFSAGPQVHIHELVTTDIKQAYVATERVKSGEEFAKVAAELSMENKQSGGDLGWMAPEDYHLADEIAPMGTGEVSTPIAEGDKYYIVYVKARADDKPATFELAKDELIAMLASTPRMNFSEGEYVELLARRANIEVTHEPLQYLNAYYNDLKRIRVCVGGEEVKPPTPVVRLASGHLLIPLKPVLQQMEATLSWIHQTQSLVARSKLGKVKVSVGSKHAQVGLEETSEIENSEAPHLREGALFGSPRVIIEALGGSIYWDGVRNLLEVTPPTSPEDAAGGLQVEP